MIVRHLIHFYGMLMPANPSGCAVQGVGTDHMYGVGLRPYAYWDWGFESHRGDGCLSLVSVVCCQVEVSATWHHSFRGVLPSVVCVCNREASILWRPWPTRSHISSLGTVAPLYIYIKKKKLSSNDITAQRTVSKKVVRIISSENMIC